MNSTTYVPEYTGSWALLIGINQYTNVSPLSFARNDAEEIADVLISEHGFLERNVTVLVDEAASRSSIMEHFLRFTQDSVRPNDRLFFFFAGHGHTYTGLHGEVGYLIPCDGNPENLATLIRWDEFTRNADLIKAKHVFFVMDACFGGLAFVRRLSPGTSRFLKEILQRYSRQALSSGKADQVVSDGGGPLPKHSVFSGHLLEALRGKAATPEGLITASGVMAYVYQNVSSDLCSKQTPHYGFLDGDGDFVFNPEVLTVSSDRIHFDDDVLVQLPLTDDQEAASEDERRLLQLAKEYLSDTRHNIKLEELVDEAIRRVLASTSTDQFPVQTKTVSKEEFKDRVERYERSARQLQQIVACIAQWGEPYHVPILRKVFSRMAEPIRMGNGKVIWLSLQWYPIMLCMYAAGISALVRGMYTNLFPVLMTEMKSTQTPGGQEEIILQMGEAIADLAGCNAFKLIPGQERYYTPRSEYLHKRLQPILDGLFFLGQDYERLFDRFEVFLALAHAHLFLKNGRGVWGPVGRFAWKHKRAHRHGSPLTDLWNEAEVHKDEWPALKAGFFDGSFNQFNKVFTAYESMITQTPRWI